MFLPAAAEQGGEARHSGASGPPTGPLHRQELSGHRCGDRPGCGECHGKVADAARAPKDSRRRDRQTSNHRRMRSTTGAKGRGATCRSREVGGGKGGYELGKGPPGQEQGTVQLRGNPKGGWECDGARIGTEGSQGGRKRGIPLPQRGTAESYSSGSPLLQAWRRSGRGEGWPMSVTMKYGH